MNRRGMFKTLGLTLAVPLLAAVPRREPATWKQEIGDEIISRTGWSYLRGHGVTVADAERHAELMLPEYNSLPTEIYQKRVRPGFVSPFDKDPYVQGFECEVVLVRRGVGMTAAGLANLNWLSR